MLIPLGRFELPSPDPKSCMIDHYTTGVLIATSPEISRDPNRSLAYICSVIE
jgi:hypothetical protein